MGGLVFREFVLNHYAKLIPSVAISSAVLLATPNLGIGLAKLVKYICKSDSLGDLISGRNGYIDILNDQWIKKFGQEESVRPFRQALKLVEDNQLDEAMTLLSIREEEEDQAIQKIAKTRFTKARVYELKLDYPNAQKYYEMAVQLDPENADYLNQAGIVFSTRGQYDKAIMCFEKALSSDIKTFGPEHPSVARVWNNLGMVWGDKGEYDKAIEYYDKALASDPITKEQEHRRVATYWNNLGAAWNGKGEYDKAIEYFEKAKAVWRKFNLPHCLRDVEESLKMALEAQAKKRDGIR